MLQRSFLAFCLICVSVTLGTGFNWPNTSSAFQESELTDTNFAKWRDRIKAKESELRWQDLPWLTSFHEGLHQAAAKDKPLVLWVMNGHPLGCT